jgi:ABC-type Na+ efflux pump permease subunit
MIEIPLAILRKAMPYIVGGILVLVILGIGYKFGRDSATAKFERQQREASAQARSEEQRRQTSIEIIRREAKKDAEQRKADSVDLDTAVSSLQQQTSSYAANVSCDPAATARGQTATRAAMVLSDLLTSANQRNAELAKAFDDARAAGLICEKSYDALTAQD